MPKNQTLHMRIDEDLKADADVLFSQIGISTSDAINIFLKQSLIYGGFPFDVRIPQFNETTKAALKEAEEIANSNNRRFNSAAEMRDSLEE